MRGEKLIKQAYEAYAARLQEDPKDTYAARSLMEQFWHVSRGTLRAAAKCLLMADPWFLAGMHTHGLQHLTTEDIEHVTPFVGAGLPAGTAARLRAQLWYSARRGEFHPDAAGLIQLKTALGYLQKVPKAERDGEWQRMVVGCYLKLDYAKYKRAFPKLLAVAESHWRATDINRFLDNVAKRKDWVTYDRYRPLWDKLPPQSSRDDYYHNTIYTNDGLRAIAAKNWTAVPAALTNAADITACPHGMNLSLVELLVAKRKYLDEARAYLEVAMKFESFGGNKEVIALRKKLEAVAKRKR